MEQDNFGYSEEPTLENLNPDVPVTSVDEGESQCTFNPDCDPTRLISQDHVSESEQLPSMEDIQNLEEKVEDMKRDEEEEKSPVLGKKMCPTRHGCTGATDCNYCMGDYPD